MKGLDILIKKVGRKPAKRFLTIAQKQLKQDHQALLHYLDAKQWKKAVEKAHYLTATSNLYASEALLNHYNFIMQKKEALQYEPQFIENLRQELRQIEKNIQDFLAQRD